MGREGIRDAYTTGRGRIIVRAKAHVEALKRGKDRDRRHRVALQVKKADA